MTFKERLFLWLVPHPQWSWYGASVALVMGMMCFWYYMAPDVTFLFRLLDVSWGGASFGIVHDPNDFLSVAYHPSLQIKRPANAITEIVVRAARSSGATIEYLQKDREAAVPTFRYTASGELKQLLEIARACAGSSAMLVKEIHMTRGASDGVVRLELTCSAEDSSSGGTR